MSGIIVDLPNKFVLLRERHRKLLIDKAELQREYDKLYNFFNERHPVEMMVYVEEQS